MKRPAPASEMRRAIGRDPQTPSKFGVTEAFIMPLLTLFTLKRFDIYPKLAEDYKVKTESGGTVSIVTAIFMAVLATSEFIEYVTIKPQERMIVDTSLKQKLRINFDITFPALTCAETSIDAMDVAGDQQLGLDHDIFKTRLHTNGSKIDEGFKHQVNRAGNVSKLPDDYCGHCYGARDGCCNTCRSVRDAYNAKGWGLKELMQTAEQCKREHDHPEQAAQKGEGCNLHGHMLVNKVAGNFHIALGEATTRDGRHIHQFNPPEAMEFNATHIVHHLSFGHYYPGQSNPLDKTVKVIKQGSGVYQYFIKIVPTRFADSWGETVTSCQYSFTQQFRPVEMDFFGQVHALPGVFFVYEMSPFLVEVTQSPVPFTHFLTKLCAIIGGAFTLSGILDAAIYRAGKIHRAISPQTTAKAAVELAPMVPK